MTHAGLICNINSQKQMPFDIGHCQIKFSPSSYVEKISERICQQSKPQTQTGHSLALPAIENTVMVCLYDIILLADEVMGSPLPPLP